jgi:hypothetical protein
VNHAGGLHAASRYKRTLLRKRSTRNGMRPQQSSARTGHEMNLRMETPQRAGTYFNLKSLTAVTEHIDLCAAGGANVTSIVQLAPAPTLPPQLSVSAKSGAFVPLTDRLEMVRVVVVPPLLS